MSIESSQNPSPENPELSRFIVRVDFEITNLGEYEKYCVLMAENAAQAQIMLNKFLLSHLYFEHFPDAFFSDLLIVDSYYTQTDAQDNAQVYGLLNAYEQKHGNIPIFDGNVILGNAPEKKAYPYLAQPLSDAEYSVLSKYMLFNDAKDLDTFK